MIYEMFMRKWIRERERERETKENEYLDSDENQRNVMSDLEYLFRV